MKKIVLLVILATVAISMACTAADKYIINPTTGKFDNTGHINEVNTDANAEAEQVAVFTGTNTIVGSANLTLTGTADLRVDGTTSITGTALFATTSGRVGIGTTVPGYRLEVPWLSGDATTTAYFGSNNASNDQIAVIGRSYSDYGVFGVSTSGYGVYGGSTSSIGVRGESTDSWGIYGSSTSGVGIWGKSTSDTGVYGSSTTGRAGYFRRNNTAGTATTAVLEVKQDSATFETNTVLRIQGDGTGDLVNIFDGATEVVTVLDGGNVGIGTTAPYQGRLHVNKTAAGVIGGEIWITNLDNTVDSFSRLAFDSSETTDSTPAAAIDSYKTNAAADYASTLRFSLYDDGGTSFTERMRIDSETGNVGIGTTDPSAAGTSGLQVIGTALFATTSGNVGIGTTAPTQKLHVIGTTLLSNGTDTTLTISTSQGATGDIKIGSSLSPGSTNSNLNIVPAGAGTAGSTVVGAAFNGSAWRSMLEYANVASGEPDLLLVKSGGNVGIGTTTPAAKLEVVSTGTGDILNIKDGATSVFRIEDGGAVSFGAVGSLVLGSSGEPTNLVFYEDSSITAVGTGTLSIGQSGNTIYLSSDGATYNFDTLSTLAGTNLTLQPGGSSYTIVGDAGSTSHSLAANDDLYVTGKLEVDGETFLDGDINLGDIVTDTITINGTISASGTASFSDQLTVQGTALLATVAGRVGIGNTAPVTKLQITTLSSVTDGIRLATSGVNWDINTEATTTDLLIKHGGGTHVTFDRDTIQTYFSGAGVGIGTTAPDALLDIDLTTTTDVGLIVQGAASQTGNLLELQASDANIAFAFNSVGDIVTDRWLHSNTNLFLGENVVGAGNLAHNTGNNGWYNIGIGYGALEDIVYGYENLAIGAGTLGNITNGYSNIGIGSSALRFDTTGNRTIAIGRRACYNQRGAALNVAIGSAALLGNWSGSYNTAIGWTAMQGATNQNPEYCVAIGAEALENAANDADGNVAIGRGSGYNVTSGGHNVFVGYQAGNLTTTGSANIIIGYDIDAPANNTNSFLNIGDLIYGEIADGEVGIGVTAPSADLSVVGTSRFGDDATNYTQIGLDGIQTMVGEGRITVDTYITASGVKAPGAKPATFVEYGICGAWRFSDATPADNQEEVSGTLKLPTQMDKTVAPVFKIGWSANGVSPGDAEWQLEYLYISPNEDTTAAAQATITVTSTASGTSDGLIIAPFAALALPSATDQAMFFRITRLSAAGSNDTIADDIELRGMLFTHTRDKLGTPL